MTDFEYINELYGKGVDFIIDFIIREVAGLKKMKSNITRFIYIQTKNGKLHFIDFQRCVSEIERITMEIDFLERKKSDYIQIKENQENQ